jgi:hypothetical protein
MVGAAAIINLAKDAAQGNIHNWGDAFGSLGTGALQGAAGAFGGAIGGRLAGAVAGKLGPMAASLGGRMLAGGVSGGVGDAVTQFAATGRVDLRGVAMSTAIGAASAGRTRGCSGHSFSPDTKVLMADGKTKAISEIRVGDKVVATDPATGKTVARTVTWHHINRDRDLTNLTVRTADGGKNTVETTRHHPFWNEKAKQFVAAGALVGAALLGAQVATPDRATAAPTTPVVESVVNYTGDREMHDLTVNEIHTYYVVAGTTPVLVHNCPTGVGSGGGQPAAQPSTPRRATMIASADGTTVPTNAARLQRGLQAAVDAGEPGFSSFPTNSPGIGYNLPNGETIRIMQPSGPAGLRASFEDSHGNAINPFTGKQPQPPKGFSGNWKQVRRGLTHVELD